MTHTRAPVNLEFSSCVAPFKWGTALLMMFIKHVGIVGKTLAKFTVQLFLGPK
jgi:hypothetical protein